MKKQILVMITALTSVIAGCKHGQAPTSQNDTTQIANPINEKSKVLPQAPTDFPGKEAIGSLMEIESSSRMIKYTENPDVQNLATIMVKDHIASNTELTAIVKKQGITLPKTLTIDKMALLKKLDSIKDESERNRFYADLMVQEHQEAVNLFSSATTNVNKDLADFATKKLPVLKHNLMEAERVRDIMVAIKNDKGNLPLDISKGRRKQ